MKETFEFTDKLKRNLYYMMGAGVVGLLVLLLYPHNHHARLWSNILLNVYYFTGIGLFGLFVVAAGQLAYGHWHTMEKRIFISLSSFTRYGGFLLALIIVLGFLNVHTLYDDIKHMLHLNPVPDKYTNKVIYYAPVFWVGRVLLYAGVWLAFSWGMDKFFARTDQTDPKVYKRSKLLSAAFIVAFALTESAISWDSIMSLNLSWYSTLFGWYNFASYGCAAWAMTILLVIYLKSKGYIERINENHVHDLGKFLFGFSILWSYMWFDQFMLQWFANMPEETSFWVKRFDVNYFTGTIFLSLAINFVFPIFFLVKRGAKRNFKMIGFGAALLIFGHYVDFFNYTFVESNWNKDLQHHGHGDKGHHAAAKDGDKVVQYAKVEEKKEITTVVTHEAEHAATTTEVTHAEEHTATPAEAKHGHEGGAKAEEGKGHAAAAGHHGHGEEKPEVNYAGIGIGEILVFIGFLGIFLFLFFRNLAKRPIIPENDPYLKENEKLEVVYA